MLIKDLEQENFIERLFSLQRWRNLLDTHRTLGGLVEFHTQNKLLILSHNQEIYRQMGRLVAQGKKQAPDLLFDAYEQLLLKVLALKTTVKKNINVLQHVMGYFKRNLSGDEKQELLDIIDQYGSGYVPLIVPITLIKHYVMKYDQPWLKTQTYLNPHPFELKLRNYY
ncbi:MAG: YbgA family protein [Pseudomonadota bacterium]